MKDILNFLLPILAVATGMFATVAWVIFKSSISASWKAGIVPLALAGAVAVPLSVGDMFGRALPTSKLPDRLVVYAHKTIIKNSKKDRIELYAAEPRQATRLFSIPYTKEMEKMLRQAQQGREQGMQSELSRRQRGERRPGESDSDSNSEWRLDLKKPEDLMPRKGAAPEETPEQRKEELDKLMKPGSGTMI